MRKETHSRSIVYILYGLNILNIKNAEMFALDLQT